MPAPGTGRLPTSAKHARPQKPCRHPGCSALVRDGSGFCGTHKGEVKRQIDLKRGTAHQRGYTKTWAVYSKARLAKHPLCECPECLGGEKRVIAATVTDHIVPHKGDMRLFWDVSNHQSMSKACHDKKTATEDGGFGNAIRNGAEKNFRK
jgi:5-methylcytosine-specific restriction protein A